MMSTGSSGSSDGRNTCRLRLAEYYCIEGLNSFACTLFINSIYFWTRARFGFSDTMNLLLGATQGGVYVLAARWGGKASDRLGYDRQMLATLALMAAVLSIGWWPPLTMAPYIVLALLTIGMGAFWPANEAVVMHSPGALSMPQRLGAYNVVWSLMGALGFFASGALFDVHANLIFLVPAALFVVEIVWLLRPSRGTTRAGVTAMALPHTGVRVPAAVKQRFMQTAWIGNCAGYVIITSMSALMPHIGEQLGLRPSHAIWLSCTMMFARGASFAFYWWWEGWHYRQGWFAAALAGAPACLAVVFFSRHIPVVFAALMLMGLALGLIYYSSLYYSMDVGESKGEHGGLHESLIGMGVLVGPLTGAAGGWLFGTVGARCTILALTAVAASTAIGWLARRRPGSAGVPAG
ncbi:MFS transporter [bacterium]|nr:MFS transporter [bacterium]